VGRPSVFGVIGFYTSDTNPPHATASWSTLQHAIARQPQVRGQGVEDDLWLLLRQ